MSVMLETWQEKKDVQPAGKWELGPECTNRLCSSCSLRVWLPIYKSSSHMVQTCKLGPLRKRWIKWSMKSLILYFHPSPTGLGAALILAWDILQVCFCLSIYLAEPNHVPGLTWDLPHHCGFVWPLLDSGLALATALFYQVLCDGELSGKLVFLPLAHEFLSLVKSHSSCCSLDSKRERSILKISPFLLI